MTISGLELQGTKTHKLTNEHALVNICMSTTHEFDHILEHTHTHTSVTAAINYYTPASRLGIAVAWTAPSHIPHNFSQTSSLSVPAPPCSSLSTGDALLGHKYLPVQTAALGHELPHLPATHLHTSCIFSVSQESALLLPAAELPP